MIGHIETDGHLGRCHLNGRHGDAASAILTAADCNFRLVLAWLRLLLLLILVATLDANQRQTGVWIDPCGVT